MNSDITLNSFPSTRIEALTMLYLEKQDLSDLTPKELVKKYAEVYSEIKSGFRESHDQKWFY